MASTNKGFVIVQGGISALQLSTISLDINTVTVSFAPRTTVPSLTSNHIDDTTGNSCSFMGKQYSLLDIQITTPCHTGYVLPDFSMTPSMEMVLTFVNRTATYSVVLLCLPIYNTTGDPNHTQYLSQLLRPDPTQKAVTLESMFYNDTRNYSFQKSFAYKTSAISIDSNKTKKTYKIQIMYFPFGLQLDGATYATLSSKLGTLIPYSLNASITDGLPLFLSTNKDGSIIVTNNRQMPTTGPIATSSDMFINTFEYFTVPPRRSTVKPGSTPRSCQPATNYKCVPFDKTKNYRQDGNLIITDQCASLDQLINKPSDSTADSSTVDSSTADMVTGVVTAGVCGIVVLILIGIVARSISDE